MGTVMTFNQEGVVTFGPEEDLDLQPIVML